MSHPRIVQWDWKRSIPQFASVLILISFFYLLLPFDKKFDSIAYSAVIYLLYSMVSRIIIPRYHRKGIRMMVKGNYIESIELFKQSVSFFEKNSWLDKYRSVFLMSPSVLTYREMGLMNIAYAYSQINEGMRSEEYYLKVLHEYPNNKAAKSALTLINAGKHASEP